jgi:prevent-host-death family protein
MHTVKASEFKAKCLALMDEVARTGEPILVTKNGKPIAELRPHRRKTKTHRVCGRTASSLPVTLSRPLMWSGMR